MKKIFSYWKPYTSLLILVFTVKFVGTVTELLIPYLLAYILDEVVPYCTKESLLPVFLWGGVMLLCAAVALFANVFANHRTARFSSQVILHIRRDMFHKTLSLSAKQLDRFTIPSLVARMSSDTYSIHSMLNVLFRSTVRAPILLLGGILITLTIEPVLALVLLAVCPFLAVIVSFVTRTGIRLFRRKQKKVDTMVEKIRDTFTGIRVIKALSKVPYEKESFQKVNEDLSRTGLKASYVMGISGPVITLFLNLGMTAVILVGAYRVSGGHTKTGEIIAFMSYFTIILNATVALVGAFNTIARGGAAADRIREVLEAPEDLRVSCPDEPVENAPFLEFRNVTFSYNGTCPTVENISFTLNRGETLGIIGGTGSGKTTLIRLLLRFYDPNKGTVLLEGRDIRTIPRKELRNRFGVVFQNDFLIAESIKENILFSRELEDGAVKRGADVAQATPFIEEIENGFDYCLTTKGANLSGGQKQRVLLARALAGNPDILVLDDSSSALDYKTDANLRSAIGKEYKDTTSVIVAQRISSIKHADLILVLDKGKLVGAGTDKELSENCQIYQEIAQSQMGERSL